MDKYQGFKDWKEVCDRYHCSVPEPDEVILAVYEGGSYEGSSIVVYRNGDEYFINEGSHCSCYGLEGQWEPESYDKSTFLKTLEMRNRYGFKKELDFVVKRISGEKLWKRQGNK